MIFIFLWLFFSESSLEYFLFLKVCYIIILLLGFILWIFKDMLYNNPFARIDFIINKSLMQKALRTPTFVRFATPIFSDVKIFRLKISWLKHIILAPTDLNISSKLSLAQIVSSTDMWDILSPIWWNIETFFVLFFLKIKFYYFHLFYYKHFLSYLFFYK